MAFMADGIGSAPQAGQNSEPAVSGDDSLSQHPVRPYRSLPGGVDEVSCLLFAGSGTESYGVYRPRAYELWLRGDEVAQHHVTHLHEIHHKVLNDDTAWGSLIHITARHPGWERLLDQLVSNCRLVHEAFASFMAASLAAQRHDNVDLVLEAYPVYQPLVGRMRRLLAPVPSGHRQDLAATAIARFCMSPPVFDLVTTRYPDAVMLADLPSSWLPDQRFSILSGVSPQTIGNSRAAADATFAHEYGQRFESLGLDETDERLDRAWEAWEAAFTAHLIAADPQVGSLPYLEANAHLVAATELVRAAARHGIVVPLPHEVDERTISDAESVQRLLTATEITLRSDPWPSVLAEIGTDVEAEAVLGLCAAGARSFLVIHGRTPAHLAAAFSFGPRNHKELTETTGPVFAVRLLIDDGGRDLILNATVSSPDAYRHLTDAWPTEQVIANCITASCFIQTEWQPSWRTSLSAAPTVVLVDTGLLGMVGEGKLLGADSIVYGIYIGMNDPTLKAMAWHVEGHPHVMLAIADDLTIQLVAGQLQDLLGDRLAMRDSDWSAWVPALSAVCASVLGTESALRYDGLGRS